MQKASQYILEVYRNVIQEQLFLQDLGVSFDYTDTIDSYSRRDLIDFAKEWRELKNQNSS